MKINKVTLIYYSPTGTSKKIVESVTKGLGIKSVEHVDLTPLDTASNNYIISADSLAVFGVPVYGGRVPIVATQRLKKVKGNGTPAVIIAVYGNRAIEDALIELKDITTEQGFKTIAGAAFIGEHSFSNKTTPIAPGRPDSEDLQKAMRFGEQVKRKLSSNVKAEVNIPGNRPYKDRNPSVPRFPETTPETCTLCGACEKVCPTKAIKITEKVETVKESCTACSACVKTCPTGARVWTNEGVKKAAVWLHTEYSKRRGPELFV